MGLVIDIYNRNKISEPQIMKSDDFLNQKEMLSYLGYFNLIKSLDIILAPSSELPLFIGNCEFMDIDYLFNYLLNRPSMMTRLSESIFAGGKGFTMHKAICSSLGEAFERLMACLDYFLLKDKLVTCSYLELIERGEKALNPVNINFFSDEQFEESEFLFDRVDENSLLSWVAMQSYQNHENIYVPAALVLMYYEPQTPREVRIGYSTSGGLTSQFDKTKGVEHGLTEIIERHEINLSWYCYLPPERIILDEIKNPKLKMLKDYIDQQDIQFFRHNVDQENFHVITGMSFDSDLSTYSFNAGGGVNEDIELAILSAIEEYAQSVNNTRKIIYAPNWLTSRMSNSVLEVREDDDPKNFKTFYQAVSYYGLSKNKKELDWFVKGNVERSLSEIRSQQSELEINEFIDEHDLKPLYMILESEKLFEHIYLSKVYMNEFSPAFIAGNPAFGHPTYREYLAEGMELNRKILPFP